MSTFSSSLFENLNTAKKTEPEKKAKLKMHEKKIHSLQELRENFDAEVILKKHANKKLEKWLRQHYYETEANAICNIKVTSPRRLRELCAALKVPYEPMNYASEEELETLKKKKEIIAALTSDKNILNNIDLVATNQSELAELLDQQENQIYLCNNTFTIPINMPDITYIGVGNVIIENAFTQMQYKKAGIEMQNINLPETENPDTLNIAKQAAADNGYDDFEEHHTSLASAYHSMLKACPYFFAESLPYDAFKNAEFYSSRSACSSAAENTLTKAYEQANNFFDPENNNSLAKKAAKYYSQLVKKCFNNSFDELKQIAIVTNKTKEFSKIQDLAEKSKKKLKKAFDDELTENRDYYEMYNFDYFRDLVDIEEHDFSVADPDNLFERIFESLVTNTCEYTISDLYTPIHEMESDMDDHANTFIKFAHKEYESYVKKIEELLEEIGKEVEKISTNKRNDDENEMQYIKRIAEAMAIIIDKPEVSSEIVVTEKNK